MSVYSGSICTRFINWTDRSLDMFVTYPICDALKRFVTEKHGV